MRDRRNLKIWVAVCVSLLAMAQTVPARTIYVDDDGPADFNNIQAAINDANDGDTIIVQPGTYTGPGNRDIDFLGKAITVCSTDPNNPDIVAETVVDCNATQYEPHRGFTFDSHEGPDSVLSGLTITGGYGLLFDPPAPPPGPFPCPTPGLHYSGGGAIWIKHASPTISHCVIRGNRAGSGYFPGEKRKDIGYGAGIYCGPDSSPLIIDCTFKGNSSYLFGGAIYCYGVHTSPSVINCTIVANDAASGGGIWCALGRPKILSCEIIGNRGSYRDFDFWIWYTTHDRYPGRGGGVCCCEAVATIHNCLFADNRAPRGGALSCSQGETQITNCTITGNCATYGGAICCYYDEVAVLENCILWQNSAEVGEQVSMLTYSFYCDGWNCWPPGYWRHPSSCAASYTNIQDTLGAVYIDYQSSFTEVAGGMHGDPLFAQNGYWGEANDPNIVVEPNDPNAVWVDGDYHLLPASPCIDGGDNNSVPADTLDLDGDGDANEPIPFDVDGDPRIVDGNNDGNSVVDMGAYEYFVPPIQVSMKFTPQALNPSSKGNWIKAHFVLPEGYAVEDVDANKPAVVKPGNIESDYMNVFINDDGLVEIEAAFGRGEFCTIVTGAEPMEVTVVGSLTSGQQFYGTDTIKITTNYLKYLGTLASRWLEAGCGKPDWCSGLDLDQDSAVDFEDYALFDGCCIEVVKE